MSDIIYSICHFLRNSKSMLEMMAINFILKNLLLMACLQFLATLFTVMDSQFWILWNRRSNNVGSAQHQIRSFASRAGHPLKSSLAPGRVSMRMHGPTNYKPELHLILVRMCLKRQSLSPPLANEAHTIIPLADCLHILTFPTHELRNAILRRVLHSCFLVSWLPVAPSNFAF